MDRASTMQSQEEGPTRTIATVTAASLLAGFGLTAVFLGTEPRILSNRLEALERAIFEVLPGATSYTAYVVDGATLVESEAGSSALDLSATAYEGRDTEGRVVGFALAGEGPGYMDTIQVLVGFDARAGRAIGLAVLENRETPGLGDKIVDDPAFHASFDSLVVDPEIRLVKAGTRSAPNEVDGISGATISSKAVVGIVNATLARWSPSLEEFERAR